MAEENSQAVGTAFIIYGTVKAVSAEGFERVLTPNSAVFQNERIVTGPDGSISIVFSDSQIQLDLGRFSDVSLDNDIYGVADESTVDTTASIEDIQIALENEDFDPTTELDPAAAGNQTSGTGGGRKVVELQATGMEVLPESGAETVPIGFSFLDPDSQQIIATAEGVPTPPVVTVNFAPTIATAPAVTEATVPVAPAVSIASVPFTPPPVPPPPTGTDRAPVAREDSNELMEVVGERSVSDLQGTSPTGSGSNSVTGNILSNDTPGDGPTVITEITGDFATSGLVYGVDVPFGTEVQTAQGGKITIDADGKYTYTIESNILHELNGKGDGVPDFESFDYTIKDEGGRASGESSSSTLTINIQDTVPTAENDVITIEEGAGANDGAFNHFVSGNVITADQNGPNPGQRADVADVADGQSADPGLALVEVTGAFADTSFVLTAADFGNEIDTALGGKIVFDALGNYTYTAPDYASQPGDVPAQELFSYTIEDGDGSQASATLTVNVTDTEPETHETSDYYFVSEYAGYDNLIGTYELVDDGNGNLIPTNPQIIVASSNDAVGGSFREANPQPLVLQTVDSDAKLFLVADGAVRLPTNNPDELRFVTEYDSSGAPVASKLQYTADNGATWNDYSGPGQNAAYNTYFMDSQFNLDGVEHFKNEYDQPIETAGDAVTNDGGYEIHMEDLYNGGDTDYSDSVLRVEKGPTVDEKNLADGTDPNSSLLTVTGDLFTDGNPLVEGKIVQGADPLTLNIDGQSLALDGTGDVINISSPTGELIINDNGTWEYTLQNSTDSHPDNLTGSRDGDSDTGTGDQVQDVFNLTVTDIDGDTIAPRIIININDDGPAVGTPQDAFLANELGNRVTGNLDIEWGADGPDTDAPALQLLDVNGNSLVGQTVDGLTSGGKSLVYVDNGSGGVKAVIADNPSQTVFEVRLNPANETYQVRLSNQNPLDNGQETVKFSGPDGTGAIAEHVFTAESGGNIQVRATGTAADGSQASVNWTTGDDGGVGVNTDPSLYPFDPYIHNTPYPNTDTLTLDFENSVNNSVSLKSAQITMDGLQQWTGRGGTFTETAQWVTYLDGQVVGQGEISGVNNDPDDVTLQLNQTNTTSFDSIEISLTGPDKSSFSVQEMQVELDNSLEYSVLVTDEDGDTTTTSFEVTFDADGNIIGTSGSDAISGSRGDDIIDAGGGDDIVYGHQGDDIIDGGLGNDRLYGQDGEDTITGGQGNDRLYGGDDNDSLNGGAGADRLYGQQGDDTLTGEDGADRLYGGTGNDSLDGGADNDRLYGQDGNDTLVGAAGNDRLDGGDGADSLTGGSGTDAAVYSSDNTGVDVNLETGSGSGGQAEGDTLTEIENITGGSGNDSLTGDSGDNLLSGGAGDDSIKGGDGADRLYGGSGDDALQGDGGADRLYGGNDDDKLAGNEGKDRLYGQDGEDSLAGGAGDDIIRGGADDADTFDSNETAPGAGDNTDFDSGEDLTSDDIDSLVPPIT